MKTIGRLPMLISVRDSDQTRAININDAAADFLVYAFLLDAFICSPNGDMIAGEVWATQ